MSAWSVEDIRSRVGSSLGSGSCPRTIPQTRQTVLKGCDACVPYKSRAEENPWENGRSSSIVASGKGNRIETKCVCRSTRVSPHSALITNRCPLLLLRCSLFGSSVVEIALLYPPVTSHLPHLMTSLKNDTSATNTPTAITHFRP